MKRPPLFTASALAFAGALAAGQAFAADKMSVGVSGYMQQWFGMADLDTDASEDDGGFAQQSDSEFYIKGSLKADSGLTFGVKFEVEGNGDGNIDESVATVSGGFGTLHIGAEDNAQSLTHYSVRDVGVTMNCGDVGAWIAGVSGCGNGLETTGWQHGDKKGLTYFTPRVSGVQLGATYIPNAKSEASNDKVLNNDENAWALGANFKGDMGGVSVAASLGHYNRANGGKETLTTYTGTGTGSLTRATYEANKADWALWENYINDAAAIPQLTARDVDDDGPGTALAVAAGNAEQLRARAAAAKAANMAVPTMGTMKTMDDRSFTNVGLRLGFGAFGFDLAYAAAERPAKYEVKRTDTADANPVMSKIVETSQDYDVMSVGAMFSDGPMAVSLSHMTVDYDAGTEAEATMFSVSYALAPGVASRTSIFTAEQGKADGTAFVTGVTIGF